MRMDPGPRRNRERGPHEAGSRGLCFLPGLQQPEARTSSASGGRVGPVWPVPQGGCQWMPPGRAGAFDHMGYFNDWKTCSSRDANATAAGSEPPTSTISRPVKVGRVARASVGCVCGCPLMNACRSCRCCTVLLSLAWSIFSRRCSLAVGVGRGVATSPRGRWILLPGSVGLSPPRRLRPWGFPAASPSFNIHR